MSEPGLFGDELPQVVAVVKLSADRRRTIRQKDEITMGRHPLTGLRLLAPDDPAVTCGTCSHRYLQDGYHAGRYPKCEKYGVTNGPGSAHGPVWQDRNPKPPGQPARCRCGNSTCERVDG